MPPPLPPWLVEAARNLVKKHGWAAVVWIARRLGLTQLTRLSDRQKAIKKARTTRDGRFAGVLLEGQLRYVVFSGERPVEAYPPIDGDLTELLRDYNGQGLRLPDDLRSKRTKRWIKERLPGREGPGAAPTEEPAEPVPAAGSAKFAEVADRLPGLLDQLTSSPVKKLAEHEAIGAVPGIYLFSEGPAPMYVGQTRNLKQRLRQHTSASSRENQASFAFRIAEEAAKDEGLELKGTRKQRADDARFKELFREARERVAEMNVQLLKLEDPVERTMFEVFVAQALDLARFNDFETH
jgi:predicted GIY-YIG superfamily endonuclease